MPTVCDKPSKPEVIGAMSDKQRKEPVLIRASWRRHLLNTLLLPAALVVVVLEDVIWAGAKAVLRRVTRLSAVQRLQNEMGCLPGWVALPIFAIPEVIAKAGEVWAVTLLARGHAASFVLVYGLVRLLSTLVAVFVYIACEAALLRIAWFAALVRWVLAVRDWSLDRLLPLRAHLRAVVGRTPSTAVRRFLSLRRWLERRMACGSAHRRRAQ
jgi:hypothetical protein